MARPAGAIAWVSGPSMVLRTVPTPTSRALLALAGAVAVRPVNVFTLKPRFFRILLRSLSPA